MKVIREICIAGRVIDVTVKVPAGRKGRRNERRNITKETIQKNNDRNARKHLARLINANFDENSFHDTLTYRNPPDQEAAQKILKNFLRRVKAEMKKKKQEFKWIVVTEYDKKRIHHHIVTNADEELVRKHWKMGHVFTSRFYDGPDYSKLAEYLIKETEKTFREEGSVNKERYSRSRNLIIPEVRQEEVSERTLFADPVPWKGYQIEEDSVRRFEHPITGLEHLEYRMIAVTEKPRLNKYYKGQRKKREESYWKYISTIEEQLTMLGRET